MAIRKQDMNKVSHDAPTMRVKEFNSFWDEVYDKISLTAAQKKTLKEQPAEFRLKTSEFDKVATEYHAFSKTVAIASAIRAWVEEMLAETQWKEHYANGFAKLYKKGIIPLFDAKGKFLTLEYFEQHGHQEILEAIRCVRDWNLFEREEIVRLYVQFSQSLSRVTRGLIPFAVDPDRERVKHKAVKYEAFVDFVTHLPERDALIAKLLYFGNLSIEEVLTLTPKAINSKTCSVVFENQTTVYPQHVILDIIQYIENKKKSQKILFTNLRGEIVDRSHLNQCFSRACEKMSRKIKITPGSLVKLEHEAKGVDID